jgi:hypothetical protein
MPTILVMERLCRRSRTGLTAAALAGLCLMFSGCGQSDDNFERVVVSGAVTFDGQPIHSGRIRFIPTGDNNSPVAGAVIDAGRYSVTNKGGVPIGAYRVEITAERLVKGANPEADIPALEQYIPVRYNRSSGLTLSVPSGQPTLEQNFPLEK